MILSNQVHCNECGDEPFSAHRHDFKSCKCGAISVDGGMDYLRRLGNTTNIRDMSITIPDEAAKAAIEGIKWALETDRNELGILGAVARHLRDAGVSLVALTKLSEIVDLAKSNPDEWDLELAARAAMDEHSLPMEVRHLVSSLWAEIAVRREAANG